MIARRLSYLAEKHGLLPNSQFGGRPGRTTEQALLVLSNAIDQAWYKHKVVTLIAFDLKGAFNGVNWVSLDASLQARGIPTVARKWIASFMSNRHANIGFDDFLTETELLAHAGLAQGLHCLPSCLNSSTPIWSTNLSTPTEARPHSLTTTFDGESAARPPAGTR